VHFYSNTFPRRNCQHSRICEKNRRLNNLNSVSIKYSHPFFFLSLIRAFHILFLFFFFKSKRNERKKIRK
jgi:hypothetical protein